MLTWVEPMGGKDKTMGHGCIVRLVCLAVFIGMLPHFADFAVDTFDSRLGKGVVARRLAA